MQTVLYISPMELGDELQVRLIHDRFPVEALEGGIGVEQLAAFIGSGFYALELTVADGDFQEQFHRFLSTPEIARFFRELSQHIVHLPLNEEGTADMPLTTQMLRWRRGGGADSFIRDDEPGRD